MHPPHKFQKKSNFSKGKVNFEYLYPKLFKYYSFRNNKQVIFQFSRSKIDSLSDINK